VEEESRKNGGRSA